jgi:hypothetical protein
MALAPLDGTDASLDLNVAINGGTSGSSLRCIIMGLEYTETRSFQEASTLCSGDWVAELPGRNQDFITINKLGTKGATISDLSPMMTATAAATVTFTASSGCTKSGTFWLSNQSIAAQAGVFAMPGQAVLRSSGAITTAWVIT